MSEPMNPSWRQIEQLAGKPLVGSVDLTAVEASRRNVYQSYETFLRDRLAMLNDARPAQWNRDYSSLPAYESSIAPMRRRLCDMLGFWINPAERAPLKI